jgi:hypothetical protein
VRPVVPLAVLALLAGVSACSTGDTTASLDVPACSAGAGATASNGVVLMAQSVPTATWIPCMRTALPLGWGFHHLDARKDISRFFLDSDRDGQQAIEVRLEASCSTAGATEITSDREGMRRFERVQQTTPTYAGKRYYVFPGGCITFVFQLDGDSRGEPLALASQVVGEISRDVLRAQVHDSSGGRLSLDAGATKGG